MNWIGKSPKKREELIASLFPYLKIEKLLEGKRVTKI